MKQCPRCKNWLTDDCRKCGWCGKAQPRKKREKFNPAEKRVELHKKADT